MQIIEKLSNMIEEEMEDAEKYIDCAFSNKEAHPSLAAAFYKLSTEEMEHAGILHDQVVALISEYRKEHGEPPEKMQWIYDYLHKKHIEKANAIKLKQNLYKTN